MDFDGVTDVAILCSQGVREIFYDCWLHDAKSEEFVKNEELSALGDPSFGAASKTITATESIAAGEWVESQYRFEKGKLILIQSSTLIGSADGQNIALSVEPQDMTWGDGLSYPDGRWWRTYDDTGEYTVDEFRTSLHGDGESAVESFILTMMPFAHDLDIGWDEYAAEKFGGEKGT